MRRLAVHAQENAIASDLSRTVGRVARETAPPLKMMRERAELRIAARQKRVAAMAARVVLPLALWRPAVVERVAARPQAHRRDILVFPEKHSEL